MKSKKVTRGGVLRFLVCLLVAFVMWLFVMYTESPEYDREYHDIKVELRNYTADYAYDIDFLPVVNMTFRGTNLALAACDSEDIVAVVDMGGLIMNAPNTHTLPVTFEFKGETKLRELSPLYLDVTCSLANMRVAYFEDLTVNVHTAGTELAGYTATANRITAVKVTGRAEDIAALKDDGLRAYVSPTAENVTAIVNGCANGQSMSMVMNVQFEVKNGIVVSGTEMPDVMVTVTFTPPENISDYTETDTSDESAVSDETAIAEEGSSAASNDASLGFDSATDADGTDSAEIHTAEETT